MTADPAHPGVQAPAPDRARRSLTAGVAVFRWLAFVWMVLGNAIESDPFVEPGLAWAGIGVAGAWTAWVTVGAGRRHPITNAIDLALATGLILLAGIVEADGALAARGARLFYAATFPLGTALSWGESRGPIGGIVATVVMGVALLFSRVVNGIAFDELTGRDLAAIANGAASYLLAGLAGGYTAKFLRRWAEEHLALQADAFRAQERAARLAERETLARRIHDSVLQSLTMIAKRGTELAARGDVPAEEVKRLASMASQQEAELRALIIRPPEEAASGTTSLRDALETVARAHEGVPVGVSAVGAIPIGAEAAREIAAAVAQALANVERHARARRAVVFAESTDGWITVTVRDDGEGFVYDEAALARDGKVGILRSIKGRIEDLGGTFAITSGPGRGTEIELRAPADRVVPPEGDLR